MSGAACFKYRAFEVRAMQWDGTLTGIDNLMLAFPQLRTESIKYHGPDRVVWEATGMCLQSWNMQKGCWVVERDYNGFYSVMPDGEFHEQFEPASMEIVK